MDLIIKPKPSTGTHGSFLVEVFVQFWFFTRPGWPASLASAALNPNEVGLPIGSGGSWDLLAAGFRLVWILMRAGLGLFGAGG